MRNWKGVLFDFDGVVVDSTPLHLKGWEFAYHDLFLTKLDPKELQSLVGRSTSAIGRILSDKSGFPTAKAELIRRKNIYIGENIKEIHTIRGIEEFIGELRTLAIPFGIVSNAPIAFITATLQHLELEFPFILGLENYQKPKPDAEPYMKGAQKLPGVKFTDHENIIVFEDSTHGIAAALAAYMTPMGICSQHSPEVLTSAGAVNSYSDFVEALQALSYGSGDKS